MADNILDVDDGTFESEVIKSSIPVVVDFWAPWCGPCKAIGPIVDELAVLYKDKVKFTKCNVDDNPQTPSKFAVRAIPTLIFVKDGSVVESITGMTAKSKLEDVIKKLL